MKRAYPQYLAAGGEKLAPELLKVLFPVNYWPLIRRYSTEHRLDPYMIAALIAQESTFTAEVRSAANAFWRAFSQSPASGRPRRVHKALIVALLPIARRSAPPWTRSLPRGDTTRKRRVHHGPRDSMRSPNRGGPRRAPGTRCCRHPAHLGPNPTMFGRCR